MAYNNYFPQAYQPAYQPQFPQPQGGVIWVQGEAGAKSYLVAPNTTVQLWDSEAQTIYLKSADASGMPSIKVLDYTIREAVPAQGQYATKDELASLSKKIDELMKMKVSE